MNIKYFAITFAAAPTLSALITAQVSRIIVRGTARYPVVYKWKYLIGAVIWIFVFSVFSVALLVCTVYATGTLLDAYDPKNMDNIDGAFLGLIGGPIFLISTPIALVLGLMHFLYRARFDIRSSMSSGESIVAPWTQLIIVAFVAFALVILLAQMTDWDWLKAGLSS